MPLSAAEIQKRFRKAHPERINQYKRKTYWNNPELAREKERMRMERRKIKDPEHWKELNRNRRTKYRYGITSGEYDHLLSSQGGHCLICGRSNRVLVLDHNHATGQIRGFLCRCCNSTLVHYENSITRRPYVEYLKRYL